MSLDLFLSSFVGFLWIGLMSNEFVLICDTVLLVLFFNNSITVVDVLTMYSYTNIDVLSLLYNVRVIILISGVTFILPFPVTYNRLESLFISVTSSLSFG